MTMSVSLTFNMRHRNCKVFITAVSLRMPAIDMMSSRRRWLWCEQHTNCGV